MGQLIALDQGENCRCASYKPKFEIIPDSGLKRLFSPMRLVRIVEKYQSKVAMAGSRMDITK